MLNRCVITVGVGNWYPLGLDRLTASLKRVNFQGELLSWRNEYPPDSPTHQQIKYGFKAYAFAEARRRGFDSALWLDCSCWAIRPLEPLFEHIEEQGYAFFNSGWLTGTWCSDAALPLLGITREQSFSIPMIAATYMGVRFGHPQADEFLRQFMHHAKDGSFNGPATNDANAASTDPRVRGHRYDQTAASVIVHRLGLSGGVIDSPKFIAYWADPPSPDTLIEARGMRGNETPEEIEADLAHGTPTSPSANSSPNMPAGTPALQ